MSRSWFAWSTLLLALSCQQEAGPRPPEAVVEEFLDRMQQVHGEPEQGRAVLPLLSNEAQANLAERAVRATAAAGNTVAPEEMIVPSRFALRFEPRHFVSTVQGQWAIVSVYGEDESNQVAEVRCVFEDDAWRVVLELPELRPIQKREEDDAR